MPRRQNKEDTYHVQQSIMAAIFRLFSQNPAPGPDGNHPADNYFLFAGAGDRGGCGPRAVCKYSGAQANRPFLYLDFPWDAAFGTAVRRVLRSVQNRHRSGSVSRCSHRLFFK